MVTRVNTANRIQARGRWVFIEYFKLFIIKLCFFFTKMQQGEKREEIL